MNKEKLNNPFFSVIVNCRDSEKYLEECLLSIQVQVFSNFEVIVLDNKSKDRTAEIASRFCKTDTRFKLIKSEVTMKLGTARNKALSLARGKYLAFLDSDDLWNPSFLFEHFKFLESNRGKIFGIGNVIEISDQFDITRESNFSHIIRKDFPPKNLFQKLLKGNFIYLSSLVIPRDFFIDNLAFNPDYVQAEDYELLLRLSREIECYRTGLAYYRIHKGNNTNLQQDRLYTEVLEILSKYKRFPIALLSYSLNSSRYFFYLRNLNLKKRLVKLRELEVNTFNLILGSIIQLLIHLKAYFKRILN